MSHEIAESLVWVTLMAPNPGPTLRGRRHECDMLDHVVDEARAGRSQVLVVRGEAGVGKSSLLDHLVSGAERCRVLRALGIESEIELAFAGLPPALRAATRPRRAHPDAAATRSPSPWAPGPGDAPDRFLVGLAVLEPLLAEVAEDEPLVCVGHRRTAQWLDQASAQVHAFRRPPAVGRTRGHGHRHPQLRRRRRRLVGASRELTVPGLTEDDARTLLEAVIPGRVDAQSPRSDRVGRAATHSLCWSCREACPRLSSPSASPDRIRCRWPHASSQASFGGSSR